MFETLDTLTPESILGLLAAFRADPAPGKIDLGVGVYRNEQGITPVMKAVRLAEQAVYADQDSKSYLGPMGNDAFNTSICKLVLGDGHAALAAARARAFQSPGGCGALRLGAELIRKAGSAGTVVHVSDPTWANHVPLLTGSGIRIAPYPYYDAATGGVRFQAMMDYLDALSPGAVVLLHGSCHNPTGADLSPAQWQLLVDLLARRQLLPFVDFAYQGLGEGVEADAVGARLVAEKLPEALIAISCSKNFGLYRERVGALIVVSQDATQLEAAMSHLRAISRGIYSMPPDHGAAVVARILGDASLAELWRAELTQMQARMRTLRVDLARALRQACPDRDFSAIEKQHGMFSLLSLSSAAVDHLRETHHIYMPQNGRINVAGLDPNAIAVLSAAIASLPDTVR
jgi:aspartate aminotransferase